ncbi:TetR/AcrR family transcriptional regulator [Duganella sp. BJB488]|uniref:TetR/AcrR family transcriptional regulator n=1 Tax=unclassified Duganella TaxID=2636909 RepID=UPI000E347626|nr:MULTISPECIES: TetR/AcrR family transcriptional regulator [unclassified Duganella]RFP20353.1 TetR/AcrR family transcriptional regulator [Duganella sp. BJB489]RFP21203.1 TetR/AcrR family transcriptional regulator [Duganella sp. BJB488]RFP33344.1 TetR/AcrR family transcriptional regulator [Duganella sp. BJB480]
MKDTSASARKSGRPRTFDAETALDKAMKVFWEKGYEGSSLPELTEAMGMNRPSLYAVFGNKENLFRMALERYGATHDPLFNAALEQPTARAVVEHFLRGNADAQTEAENPHGCLVINGALACSDDALPIRHSLIERRAASEAKLRARLERAKVDGDLPVNSCSGQLARYVMTVSNGMAVQAAAGATRKQLQEVVDQVLRGWPS